MVVFIALFPTMYDKCLLLPQHSEHLISKCLAILLNYSSWNLFILVFGLLFKAHICDAVPFKISTAFDDEIRHFLNGLFMYILNSPQNWSFLLSWLRVRFPWGVKRVWHFTWGNPYPFWRMDGRWGEGKGGVWGGDEVRMGMGIVRQNEKRLYLKC